MTYPSEDGRTTLTESTLSIKRCQDLRAEHDQIIKLQRYLTSSRSDTICVPERGTAHEWTPKDLPTCHIDCTAPLACMASEACKCTRDRCGDKLADGPFPTLRYSDRLSFNDTEAATAVGSLSLTERVEAIPWESLILPGARRAFATPVEDLPAAHVIELPETIDNHLTSAACWNLDKSPLPFVGDHFLVEALRNRSVTIDEADFVVVPYYQVRCRRAALLSSDCRADLSPSFARGQGCYYNYLQENTFKKLADTVGYAETRVAAAKHISASRIIIPFTHDFGSCTGWWPKLEDVLGRSPPSPMDQAIAWQVSHDERPLPVPSCQLTGTRSFLRPPFAHAGQRRLQHPLHQARPRCRHSRRHQAHESPPLDFRLLLLRGAILGAQAPCLLRRWRARVWRHCAHQDWVRADERRCWSGVGQ